MTKKDDSEENHLTASRIRARKLVLERELRAIKSRADEIEKELKGLKEKCEHLHIRKLDYWEGPNYCPRTVCRDCGFVSLKITF